METFLVLLEHEDGIIKYLIDADEIAYTTKDVCLMIDHRIVAHFSRNSVISVSPYDENALLSNDKELEE